MAVQRITGKKIIKINTHSPNYRPVEDEVQVEIGGNIKETLDDDIYGDGIYYAKEEPNGNLKLEEMMAQMLGKIDKFGNRIDGKESQTGTEAIEVDIQRDIAIGKVLTKKDKLKALRIRERRRNGEKV